MREKVHGYLAKFKDAYKKMDQPKKDIVKGKVMKLFSDVKSLVALKKAAAARDERRRVYGKVRDFVNNFRNEFKQLDDEKKVEIKTKMTKVLTKAKDAITKMDAKKKHKLAGGIRKVFDEIKELHKDETRQRAEDARAEKLDKVTRYINRFKDAFDHLDDEKKHVVAGKVKKLYSDMKQLVQLKRDAHHKDMLATVKGHLKDFIASKIEKNSATKEEKDAKHAKIAELVKHVAQSLRDNGKPKSKDEIREAVMDVATKARDIIATHPAEKKSDPLKAMLGHVKEFIGKMIEKTSDTQEEKDSKHERVSAIMHAAGKALKDGNIPKTKAGLKDSLKSMAHDIIDAVKK